MAVDGIRATNIVARIGTNWFPLGDGLGGTDDGSVITLATMGDILYAAGAFLRTGSAPLKHIARWDGREWSDVGGGLNNIVFTLATDGTNLYAGGHLSVAGSTPANKIARWNGSEWFPLGSGLTKLVYAHGWIDKARVDCILSLGSDLIVGGEFFSAGGKAATNIARWDGSEWHSIGSRLNRPVRSLALFKNQLYAAGDFIKAGGAPAQYIASWDGNSWSAVGGSVDEGYGLHALITDGNNLYAGGYFTSIGGAAATNIAMWDGSAWCALGTGFDPGDCGGIFGLASNGSHLLAGATGFTNVAIWHIPQTLKVDTSDDVLSISWPRPDTSLVLEASVSLDENSWSPVDQPPTLIGHRWTITTNTSGISTFFRLRGSD